MPNSYFKDTVMARSVSIRPVIICFFFLSLQITALCQEDSGEPKQIRFEVGSVVSFDSELLEESRDLYVILPRGYESSGLDYPVLYFLDGSPFTSAWIYPSLFNRGMPPLIAVGIGNVDRSRDMYFHEVGEPWPTAGHADQFLKVIKDEIVPFIDANYRTTSYRAIIGGSAAGMFSTWAFFTAPELFDGCVAMAPVLGHGYAGIKAAAESCYAKLEKDDRKIVFVYGENDYPGVTGYARRFANFLDENAADGLQVVELTLPGQGHFATACVPIGLTNLFGDYLLPGDVFTADGEKGLTAYFDEIAAKYGIANAAEDLTSPIALRNAADGFVLDMRYEDGIALLDFGMRKHPDSSMLVYYKAQLLELDGRMEEAIALYEKAVEMGGNDSVTFLSKLKIQLAGR